MFKIFKNLFQKEDEKANDQYQPKYHVEEIRPEEIVEDLALDEQMPEEFLEESAIEEEIAEESVDNLGIEDSVIEEMKTEVSTSEIQLEDQSEKPFWGISISSLKDKISQTSETLIGNVLSLASGKEEIDDDMLEEMEEKLIKADLGLDLSVGIVNNLRANKSKIGVDGIKDYLKAEFSQILSSAGSNILNIKDGQLNIILITGVNGVGKTTLIGKLAYRYKQQGKKVLVAAGDTFRAAAEEQLEIWTNRAGAEIVRKDGADPASVVFDAIQKAKENNFDILLVDTAGRLQNKLNLMDELGKIKKIIDREGGDYLVESMLVIDATTGQNGLKQAEVFNEAVQLTSVALTKLDGTAKGGIIISIAKAFSLPVKLIGVGEKLLDLKDFNSEDYIDALFG